MKNNVRLHIWGDYACFTRPEMKAERVSYDVITPSAARGILSSIHWKPAINWVIDKIYVLKPIRFETIRRNELGHKISQSNIKTAMKRNSLEKLYTIIEEDRQQRAATVLKDVAYVIEAHIVLTDQAGESDNLNKHLEMFQRRAAKGQCFRHPCMGVREFPANFCLIEENEALPQTALSGAELDQDLGWMLHDIDFNHNNTPHFFRAKMQNSVITVPPFYSEEVKL
ncbi:type I-C CRISPR-associated protein Cas5c [Gallibacterium anatis]|uniref:pre-crRNA processing endonuclease n=1 Tax=Gallibacterium anatis TaxID=750 RepID=A0A0A3AD54_9PAST|nr:type I-C CRISPR-associated protein Cas5c [Gallibacterium anatis]KGQ58429.1 CRISPR-associated protein [Gallibacterium anatis DSM 16844 = F 149]KGQ67251.1 CRISPR-associated protein [Gallibacterium anatis]MDK9560635.1 type I-C CRISPR-associated protein Cas5c [Gallibacterium anatis]STO37541.1 CRISPR-associated protein Cas5, subtype I-C/DVULG [Gallibacterium anatis]